MGNVFGLAFVIFYCWVSPLLKKIKFIVSRYQVSKNPLKKCKQKLKGIYSKFELNLF